MSDFTSNPRFEEMKFKIIEDSYEQATKADALRSNLAELRNMKALNTEELQNKVKKRLRGMEGG